MKGFLINFIGGLAFLSASFTSSANSSCVNANPTSVNQVFECIATATFGPYNNKNPFERSENAQCITMKGRYQQVLGMYGVKQQDLSDKTPSCEVFVEVMTELNGHPPYWEECLGYSPGPTHMVKCLTNIAKKAGQYDEVRQRLSNCQMAQSSYESVLKSIGYSNRISLPENYVKVDCDEFLGALAAETQEGASQSPCAQFDANDVVGHATTCLLADPQLKAEKDTLTCQILRQTYQQKLREIYGNLPQGFRLIRCSELDNIIAAF